MAEKEAMEGTEAMEGGVAAVVMVNVGPILTVKVLLVEVGVQVNQEGTVVVEGMEVMAATEEVQVLVAMSKFEV